MLRCRRRAGTGKAYDAPPMQAKGGDPVRSAGSVGPSLPRSLAPCSPTSSKAPRRPAGAARVGKVSWPMATHGPASMEGRGMHESSARQCCVVSDRGHQIGRLGRGEQRLPLSGRDTARCFQCVPRPRRIQFECCSCKSGQALPRCGWPRWREWQTGRLADGRLAVVVEWMRGASPPDRPCLRPPLFSPATSSQLAWPT